MNKDFLGLVDTPFISRRELTTRAIEGLAPSKTFDFWKRCYGVETDEVVEHEVSASDGTSWVSFCVHGAKLVPFLEKGLDFFEAEHGTCFGDCPASSAGAEEI